MNPRLRPALLAVLVCTGCVLMAWVEVGLSPTYWTKSLLKILIFGGCTLLYGLLSRDESLFSPFRKPSFSSLKQALFLAAGVFIFLLGGYAVLSPWLDLSGVTGNLGSKEGITAAQFPLVALYISLVNSLLEEWFFRGFAYLNLRRTAPRFAFVFSSLAFALYHVCIMGSWFHPVLLLLLIAGLVIAGMLFNLLDRKGSLWCGWLVHMSANLAINTIALILVGYFSR